MKTGVFTVTTGAMVAFMSAPGWAHHDMTPLREAVMDGHSHQNGAAIWWLAVAVIAMVVALWAVQRTVFRKR